jgi:hypothetical protein
MWKLGRLFNRKAAAGESVSVQLRPNDGQGPYTQFFKTFIPRKVQGSFYEFLREAIPICDAGINRLVSLDGRIEVEGDNADLVDEIKDWLENVPVNDIQNGFQAFHQNFTAEAFEQGFAMGEFVSNKARNDIAGLRVADSKFIKFQRSIHGGLDIYQKSDDDLEERLLNPETLCYFSLHNENQNPYGVPLLRSCEFVCQVLATMDNALLNIWERFGDPSFFLKYKTSKKDGSGATLEERRKKLSDDLTAAVRKKRDGYSSDFVAAIDLNSDMTIDIIGANGQTLEIEVPARHVMEQIIAKIGLPAWMLGMHWSTSERLSDVEAEMLLADVNTRQSSKLPIFTNIVKTMLLLRGRTWKRGDWQLKFAQVNLRDILKQAQARFMNAQADMYDLQNGETQPAEPKTAKTAKFPIIVRPGDKDHGCKEMQRPSPWPELDKVEDDYLNELKYEWDDLKERIFLILKLNEAKSSKDLPELESFDFTPEQRAMVLQSYKDWLGTFDIKDENSPVTWYYGQAYSLGLIQAAKLIGKDMPVLDVIKNSEIFNQICKDGFNLVKDNATKAIINQIIPAIDAHVIAGTNPRQIAGVLEKLFEDQNSDWERLARSELTMAAEKAKKDEWTEWNIKNADFVPSPDACPLCVSVAGRYPLPECPLPVKDTHPRCRCSLRPVA